MYWIYGKAGSGKSTLMRYLFDNPRTLDDLRLWSGDMPLEIAAFFFWNSGTTEQRSQAGLRCLLFQILRHRTHLISHVLPELWDFEMSRILRPSQQPPVFWTWTLTKLQKAFRRLATQEVLPLKICLFIDGPDEYNGYFPKLVEFCQNLANLRNIKLCVSSRPLVVFDHAFRTRPGLRLQDLTAGDIEIYARGMLLGHDGMLRLAQREPEGAPRLITEIVEAADGVFLWVKLVVKSLLEGLGNRDRITDLQRRLHDFPRDLEDFYQFMLQRIPEFYLENASRLFQIARASQEIGNLPLTTLALYFADDDPNIAIMAPIKHMSDSDVITCCEDMDIRLKACCAGFLEVSTDSDNLHSDHSLVTPALKISKRKVLYLHRTARDFLERPDRWAEVLQYTSETSFNPHVALLRSTVMRLKVEIFTNESANNSFENVWDVVGAALLFARDAEAETGYTHRALLNELKHLGIHHWDNMGYPRAAAGTWVTLIWGPLGRASGDAHTTKGYCHCQYSCCDHDLISLCIRYGMPLYALEEIRHDPTSISRKTGRPWLDVAVSPQLSFQVPSPPAFPNLDLVSILLKSGSSPELPYLSITPWQRALECVSDEVNLRTFDARMRWTQVLKLMLEYGASPRAKAMSAHSKRRDSALAIVTRALVEGSSGDDEIVHSATVELQRLLMEKQTGYKIKTKVGQFLFWQ